MIPDRCSVKQKGRQCVNPPTFVISVVTNKDEYMIGVICDTHKNTITEKLDLLQKDGKIPGGKIKFEKLKVVGTDCIKTNPDDLILLNRINHLLSI